jgi:hypothetical protein
MVFNTTFNNISVLLVEEPGENHRPTASYCKVLWIKTNISIRLLQKKYWGTLSRAANLIA